MDREYLCPFCVIQNTDVVEAREHIVEMHLDQFALELPCREILFKYGLYVDRDKNFWYEDEGHEDGLSEEEYWAVLKIEGKPDDYELWMREMVHTG